MADTAAEVVTKSACIQQQGPLFLQHEGSQPVYVAASRTVLFLPLISTQPRSTLADCRRPVACSQPAACSIERRQALRLLHTETCVPCSLLTQGGHDAKLVTQKVFCHQIAPTTSAVLPPRSAYTVVLLLQILSTRMHCILPFPHSDILA